MPVIASTGAMLVIGHEAPVEVSALACRNESWIRFAKAGNSRQVSGASNASKMQSKLVTHKLSELKIRTADITHAAASDAPAASFSRAIRKLQGQLTQTGDFTGLFT